MKILLIADPGIPVPPVGYGGIERMVYILAKTYTEMGHSVDIFAGPGSHFNEGNVFIYGKQVFPKTKKEGILDVFRAWKFLFSHISGYDLVHNFGRLAYFLPFLKKDVHKIMSYQREITASNVRNCLKLPHKKIYFTGCSQDLVNRAGLQDVCKDVHNSLVFEDFKPNIYADKEAPLMFLGRIEKVKGLHIAIDVALETGNKLWIGGNISDLPEEKKYFEEMIKPRIDNNRIIYLGTLNDEQKKNYLQQSKALLFPIEWNEPFGIVMIESMACGTPVIGFAKGSVPEVIDEDITGYIVNNANEMKEAVLKIENINRKRVYDHSCSRFDVSVIARQYLEIIINKDES
jgi:glycosyltransferase involved in cell wall biosynthesis